MLSQLFKDTSEHFRLKSLVECRVTQSDIPVSSPQLLSNAIAEQATDYSSGNRAIIFDLVHKQLINSLRARLQGHLIPHEIKASLTLVERLNANLITTIRPSRQLQQLFYIFTLAWFQVCVNEPEKSINSKQPGFELLKLMIYLSRRIDQYSGELARNLCRELFSLFLEFAKSEQDLDTFNSLLQNVRMSHEEFLKRRRYELEKNIELLRDEEIVTKAREAVSIKLLDVLGRGTIVLSISELVYEYLSVYLIEQWVEYSCFDPMALESLSDIRYLNWALTTTPDYNFLSCYRSKIKPTFERISGRMSARFKMDSRLDTILNQMEHILEAKSAGNEIIQEEVCNTSLLERHNYLNDLTDKWYSKNTKLGTWFTLKIGDKEVTSQVLAKEKIKHKLVFIDYSGRILMIFDTSLQGFNIDLINVSPINKYEGFGQLFSRVENEMENSITDFNCSYSDIIDVIESEDSTTKINETNLNCCKNIVYKVSDEETKANNNESIVSFAHCFSSGERSYRNYLLADETIKRDLCALEVERMKVGATIIAVMKTQEQIKFYLKVIAPNGTRFIFTDKHSLFKLTISRQKFIQQLLNGKIKVLTYGRGGVYHQKLASLLNKKQKDSTKFI